MHDDIVNRSIANSSAVAISRKVMLLLLSMKDIMSHRVRKDIMLQEWKSSRQSFRHQNNQDCWSRLFWLTSPMERLLSFIVHSCIHHSVFTWIRVNLSSWIRLLSSFTSLLADSRLFKSANKTIRLRRWFGLIGNHDYDRKKGTQSITIESHSDEILIVFMAKGTHCVWGLVRLH